MYFSNLNGDLVDERSGFGRGSSRLKINSRYRFGKSGSNWNYGVQIRVRWVQNGVIQIGVREVRIRVGRGSRGKWIRIRV